MIKKGMVVKQNTITWQQTCVKSSFLYSLDKVSTSALVSVGVAVIATSLSSLIIGWLLRLKSESFEGKILKLMRPSLDQFPDSFTLDVLWMAESSWGCRLIVFPDETACIGMSALSGTPSLFRGVPCMTSFHRGVLEALLSGSATGWVLKLELDGRSEVDTKSLVRSWCLFLRAA